MIEECLRSMMALDHENLQILVIDQSTNDETRHSAEGVAIGDPRVTIVSSATVGASVARNLAADLTTSDIIAFADDDCVVDPGWLDALLREFLDPRVAAVYGRVVPPGFTTRNGTEIAFKESLGRTEFSGHVPPWHVGHGASMALRRSALTAIGGFDVGLGPGAPFHAAEDLDLAYRLLSSGGLLVYTGAAVAYHKAWRDWPARRQIERSYGIGAGAAFMKYLRGGDAYGARLFARWTWELGVRRVGAGLLKWRSIKPMYFGYCQLVYPWIGAVRSLSQPVDRISKVYAKRSPGVSELALTATSKAAVDRPHRTTVKTPLRLLVVQSNPIFSSEANVLHTLLKHAHSGDVKTLILQGSGNVKTGTAGIFAGLDGVQVDEMSMNRLGQSREGSMEVLHKAGTAARLLTYDFARLVRTAERFQPQAVYSTQRVWDVRLAGLLARALGVPRVIHLHYTPGPWLGSGTLGALRSADLVICVSDYIRRQMVSFADPSRLRVLHNAVEPPAQQDRAQCLRDLSRQLDLPDGAILVGMVARLNPLKGQVELLKAMQPLLTSNPRLQLLLVGKDDLTGEPVKHALNRLRVELGVSRQVHLLGQRPDVPKILAALNVFAHPSRQEPFCLSILEAMAQRLPVVALAEGGTTEQVVDEQTGLLTPPDHEHALTEALRRLVSEPELAAEMGERGYARILSEFNPKPRTELFLDLLNGLRR
jgi:glycosyltransferase involved in cell wall biosynthesis